MCHVAPGGERELAILQMESRLREEIEVARSEEHTSELQSLRHLVCRLLLEKKKKKPTREPSTAKKDRAADETKSPNFRHSHKQTHDNSDPARGAVRNRSNTLQ